jgi:hypothetical protein
MAMRCTEARRRSDSATTCPEISAGTVLAEPLACGFAMQFRTFLRQSF